MAWKTNLACSYSCNGELLSTLRKSKGWTQRELASAVGYSERLISKAEAGLPISKTTIANLADALSTPDRPVFPEELIIDPVKLARQFIAAFHFHQENIVAAIRYFLDEEVVFKVIGDPTVFPLAGEYHGISEVEQFFDRFFAAFEVSKDIDLDESYFCFARDTEVTVWGNLLLQPIGTAVGNPVTKTYRMMFCHGRVVQIETIFDTLKLVRILRDKETMESGVCG